jgi:hypothetical protein
MYPSRIEEIVNGYVNGARHDYIGLWQIVVRVRHDFGLSDSLEIRRVALEIVSRLLSKGIEAVTLASSGAGCVLWENQDPTYIIRRISSEWEELGHDPSVGDIVWFNNPSTH